MFQHDAKHLAESPDTSPGASTASGLTLKWKTFVGGGKSGIVSSPAAVYNATRNQELVYAATQGAPAKVMAIDAVTGTPVWTYTVSGGVRSSPAVSGNTVYFGDQNHSLYALNATTGAFVCSYATTGQLEASPVVGNVDGTGDVVFIGDRGTSEKHNFGHEWAINGVGNSNGQCTVKWSFNGFLNTGVPPGTRTGSWSSTALTQDKNGKWLVVFGTSNPDNAVYALAAVDGTELWRFFTSNGGDADVGAGPTIGSPGVNGFADGVVYVDAKNGVEFALDLGTGSLIWNLNLKAAAAHDAKWICTAALVGADLVVSGYQYVFDVNAVTGMIKWRSVATGTAGINSSPAVAGGPGDYVIFSGDLAGTLHAYRLSDGTQLFTLSTGSTIVSSNAVADGMVFFGALDGNEYGLG